MRRPLYRTPQLPKLGTDVTGIPGPLGIPLPLWQQPLFFVLGATIIMLALAVWRGRSRPGPVPDDVVTCAAEARMVTLP